MNIKQLQLIKDSLTHTNARKCQMGRKQGRMKKTKQNKSVAENYVCLREQPDQAAPYTPRLEYNPICLSNYSLERLRIAWTIQPF